VKYSERSRVELEKCPVSLVKEGINVETHGDSNLGKDSMNEENCLFSRKGANCRMMRGRMYEIRGYRMRKRACVDYDSPFLMNEGNGIILVEVAEVGRVELDLGWTKRSHKWLDLKDDDNLNPRIDRSPEWR
jgi:hypothetical protein